MLRKIIKQKAPRGGADKNLRASTEEHKQERATQTHNLTNKQHSRLTFINADRRTKEQPTPPPGGGLRRHDKMMQKANYGHC